MAKKIGLDTSIWIYLLENNSKFVDQVSHIFSDIESGKISACFSAIGLSELLTGPKKLGRFDVVAKYKQLISTFPNLDILGVNEHTVDLASDLRAKYGIRTPDAIHLASAIDWGAVEFLCNDKVLRKVREIKIKIL